LRIGAQAIEDCEASPEFPSDETVCSVVLTVLGIETSCDETAASVVCGAVPGPGRILSNVVASQFDAHRPYGGVVPEIAARAHAELVDRVVEAALDEAGLKVGQLDAIAVTAGPGLVGGVAVGLTIAKAMALAGKVPLVALNHLEAHALTARLVAGIAYPYLLLLVSGGHCQLLICSGVGRFQRLGTTIDDAVGEAFDKTAKLLGLGFPGGPAVEKAAKAGDPTRFKLPRPMAGSRGYDFSFSGLKSAVRRHVEITELSDEAVADLAASFQRAAVEALVDRTEAALLGPEVRHCDVKTLVVAGGVAANSVLSAALRSLAERHGVHLVVPPPSLCTDNAAMVAWAGLERFSLGLRDDLGAPARARWPLDAAAAKPGAKA
jgi:N6-L-threonylcarbamoyladenine synthase